MRVLNSVNGVAAYEKEWSGGAKWPSLLWEVNVLVVGSGLTMAIARRKFEEEVEMERRNSRWWNFFSGVLISDSFDLGCDF